MFNVNPNLTESVKMRKEGKNIVYDYTDKGGEKLEIGFVHHTGKEYIRGMGANEKVLPGFSKTPSTYELDITYFGDEEAQDVNPGGNRINDAYFDERTVLAGVIMALRDFTKKVNPDSVMVNVDGLNGGFKKKYLGAIQKVLKSDYEVVTKFADDVVGFVKDY